MAHQSVLRIPPAQRSRAVASLSPDAITVLDEIASAGQLPSAELAGRCGQTPDRIGTAIGVLVQAGLVSVFRGKSAQPWVRLTAHASVSGLLHTSHAKVAPKAKKLLEARTTLEEVLGEGSETLPGVERLTDPQAVRDAVQAIADETRREVMSVLAGPPPEPSELAGARQYDLELARRLVTVRVLYPMEYAGLGHVATYAEDLAGAGTEVRFADRVPHRLLVFDRKIALVPIDNDDLGAGALVVRESILTRSLAHLAMTMFRRGRPLGEAIAGLGKHVGPTPLDRRVLMLMSSGLGDAACAQRLGVTDRTFRRYVGSLLSRLGASGRFDAGVKAVEQGWI